MAKLRIKQADVAGAIQQFLENVRTGLLAAQGAGLVTMPEMEFTFEMDVIQTVQSLTQETLTSEDETGSDSTERNANQETTNNATEETVTNYEYGLPPS